MLLISESKNKSIHLLRQCAVYFNGEKRVGTEYFTNGKRTQETDAIALGYQANKEYTGSGVYGKRGINVGHILKDAGEQLAKINVLPSIDEIAILRQEIEFGRDESKHFFDLVKAYKIADPNSSSTIEELGALSEGKKLLEIRYKCRNTPLGRVAVDLSEGGGLGIYFAICQVLSKQKIKSELDKLLLNIAKNTLSDEKHHMAHRYLTAYNMDYSTEEWEEITDMLISILWQKLLERNQQFSSPFSEAQLRDIVAQRDLADRFIEEHLGFLLRHLSID
jgi:hypothetical protein